MHLFEAYLNEVLQTHDWESVTSLVAVSGGADSVALLRGLEPTNPAASSRLVVAHFNHRLRGEASDGDEAFVAELAVRLGLRYIVGRAAEGELAVQADSREAAARDARYRFFQESADQLGARYLFTAHTADDQAETILHRIVRGTGVAGLRGIPRVRALSSGTTIVRPLLDVRRTQILEYLRDLDQPFREDATNRDVHFTRNRLRHDLLPKLAAEYNASVVDALLQLGELAYGAQQVIDVQAARLAEECVVEQRSEQVVIVTPALAALAPFLVRELFIHVWQVQHWPLQAMSFDKWHELAALAISPSDATLTLPSAIRAQKQGEKLVLTRPEY